MTALRYGSVCSGIEAATVAWESLGWDASFFSEIEAFPRAVLAHHYPSTPLHGDFTTIQAGQYEPIDILVGGTPCQSFSVAGLRGGMADERGNLALEYLRLADRLRPRWLVWENVPGVLSSNGGRDFGSFLGGLVKLGYGFAYRVLDAQFFGLAQRRKRVFVVGYLGDWRRAAAVLFEPASLRWNPAPSREAGQIAANALTERPDRGGGNSEGQRLVARPLTANRANGSGGQRYDFESETFVAGTLMSEASRTRGAGISPEMLVANPLGSKKDGGWRGDLDNDTYVTHSLRAEGFDANEDGTGRGTPLIATTLRARDGAKGVDSDCTDTLVFDTTQITSPTCRSNPQPGEPCHPLSAHAHAPAVAFDARQRDVCQYGPLSGPLDTDPGTNGVLVRSAVRRITPRECERLQGFPDGYTAVRLSRSVRKIVEAREAEYLRRDDPSITDKELRHLAADGPRYRALGNSMAVPVMAWIGRRIEAQL